MVLKELSAGALHPVHWHEQFSASPRDFSDPPIGTELRWPHCELDLSRLHEDELKLEPVVLGRI